MVAVNTFFVFLVLFLIFTGAMIVASLAYLEGLATICFLLTVISGLLVIGYAPMDSETEVEKAYSLSLVGAQTVEIDDMYVIDINNNEYVFSKAIPKENVVVINSNEISPHLDVVTEHGYVLNILGQVVEKYTEEKYYLTIPANSIA